MEETTQVNQTIELKQKPKKRSFAKIIGIIIAVIIIIIIAVGLWLYYSPASAFKSKVMQKLSYPLTLVNGKAISYSEVTRRYEIAKKGDSTLGPITDPAVSGKILKSLIEGAELKLLATKYSISSSNQDMDYLFEEIADTTTSGDKQALATRLEKMGVTVDEFKKDILEPQIIFTNLAVWFNTQRQFNVDSYKKMDVVQQAISQGQTFEEAAKTYSEDDSSKNLEGNMGSLPLKTILPELSVQIATMKTGEVKLITSRYGLHLIKVDSIDTQAGTYKLKQIFIKAGDDFQNWFDQQKKSYRVTTLVRHF